MVADTGSEETQLQSVSTAGLEPAVQTHLEQRSVFFVGCSEWSTSCKQSWPVSDPGRSWEEQKSRRTREHSPLICRTPGSLGGSWSTVHSFGHRRRRTFQSIQRCWWIVIGSRYGLRGVRLGEARNPGPPKILRRPSVRSNIFEILSSAEEQVEVPSTVPASEGAVRVARRRSLVILSDSILVAHRVLQSTIPDAGSEDAQHHISGIPVVSDIEDPTTDDTVSVVGGAHVGEKASVFSEDFESVAGDVAPSEVESDPTPLEDVNPNRVLREAMSSLDEVDGMVLLRRRAVVLRSLPRFMRGVLQIRAQVRPPGGQRRQGFG